MKKYMSLGDERIKFIVYRCLFKTNLYKCDCPEQFTQQEEVVAIGLLCQKLGVSEQGARFLLANFKTEKNLAQSLFLLDNHEKSTTATDILRLRKTNRYVALVLLMDVVITAICVPIFISAYQSKDIPGFVALFVIVALFCMFLKFGIFFAKTSWIYFVKPDLNKTLSLEQKYATIKKIEVINMPHLGSENQRYTRVLYAKCHVADSAGNKNFLVYVLDQDDIVININKTKSFKKQVKKFLTNQSYNFYIKDDIFIQNTNEKLKEQIKAIANTCYKQRKDTIF